VANPIEPTVPTFVTCPCEHAANIELPVVGMEASAHHPGGEVGNGKGVFATLKLSVYLFVKHHENAAHTVGHVQ
jgi:hypothetical protein